MKSYKNTHTQAIEVFVAGKGKVNVQPGEIFKCHDAQAQRLLEGFGSYFIEVDERNIFEKNMGLWMFLTLLVSILSLLFTIFY